jgi:hypothetical protein
MPPGAEDEQLIFSWEDDSCHGAVQDGNCLRNCFFDFIKRQNKKISNSY